MEEADGHWCELVEEKSDVISVKKNVLVHLGLL